MEERKIWQKKSRIVMVAGSASHGGGSHEHPAGCAFLADQLNKTVDGVEAVVSQGWPTDPATFADTDAIIIYSDGGAKHLTIPHLDQIAALMAQGIGLAMLHYAVEVPKGEPGDRFLDWIGGYLKRTFRSIRIGQRRLQDFLNIQQHAGWSRFRWKMNGIITCGFVKICKE